jgi:DNA-binding CsgD family transcriptional regulator
MTTMTIPTSAIPAGPQFLIGLLASGHSDADIAATMGILPGRARTHVNRALVLVGAESRQYAVAMAYRHGWLTRQPTPRCGPPLPPRQLEAMQLRVAGATVSQAAILMGLLPAGYRGLEHRAADRLGARTLAHAVRLAIDSGVVELPDEEQRP